MLAGGPVTRRLALISAFLSTVALNAYSAPPRPNFSGSWELQGPETQQVTSRSGKASTVATPYSSSFDLKQTAAQVTVKGPSGALLLLAMLDGSETSDIHDGFDFKTTAAWVGQKLIITIQTKAGPVKRSLSLDDQKNLVVEVSAQPSGPSAKFVYKKKSAGSE